MMPYVRIGMASLLLTGAAAASASAQTEEHKFALGGDFLVRVAPADRAHGANDFGLIWRFGRSHTGWGWAYGLNWFSTDVDQSIGGLSTELGELRVRPFMAGYGYTHVINSRTSIQADVLGGYAFTSFQLIPSASDVYRDRLGARSVGVTAGNTFVAKPEVGVWFDVSRKVGVNVSAGYMVARPTLTVNSSLGSDQQRFQADMFMLWVGAVYKIF
jgi:outer membrane protein W